MMKYLLAGFAIVLTLLFGGLALAVMLGGPTAPSAMPTVNDPFNAVDYSGLPELSMYPARDGQLLAFRRYTAVADAPKGSVVLLHGSSADSRSMHPLAKTLADAGYQVYSLDVRGHGSSGAKGDIAYVGQLENDLQDFVEAIKPGAPLTLLGFSSGGGFALRVAGGAYSGLFDRYLLLAPFISQNAPTYRSGGGGWVDVGLARYIALSILTQMGVAHFNYLPVVSYALSDQAREILTPEYSFSLAENYRPQADYAATIRSISQLTEVLVGTQDELFHTEQFSEIFSIAKPPVPVTLVEGADHIGMSLQPAALEAVIAAMGRLESGDGAQLR